LSRHHLGKLKIGRVPRVVGSIACADTLGRIRGPTDLTFDVAEIRWDMIGTEKSSVITACHQIEKTGAPVILTIRSSLEGGEWTGDEARRLALYKKALPHVSAVDVEISSSIFQSVLDAAHKEGKTVIGSFHDFEQTPDAKKLRVVIHEGRRAGADLVKIATMIHEHEDIATLFKVLHQEGRKPLCLIGMGQHGVSTRVTLACEGSCLTYGYADRSAAPGQTPSSTLVRRLRTLCPAYEKDYLSHRGLVELSRRRPFTSSRRTPRAQDHPHLGRGRR
jgi:3-dehydroquinate dehydratase I